MAKQETITVQGFRCLRCGWTWVPRAKTSRNGPRVCPKCKRVDWDKTSEELAR